MTAELLNQRGAEYRPGHLGIRFLGLEGRSVHAELPVRKALMAPNGFLHAGSVVTLADTCAGYGCMANMPEGGTGFTTIELSGQLVRRQPHG